MSYTVVVSDRARKDISDLSLAENPRPNGVKKLQGKEGYRVRVGDYRVIYDIKDAVRIVRVERVAHRGDAYRN